ncbi:MAG: DUF3017 domain-containing protein [Gordonia sp. (in: high G+C Gram-positive bacteria)]|uniref:DUF3017 domain-containing protein n=1 Tax=Gordonia sp. (in: high G+C Gram-positive bacteria) TaxID=84139 RepID=UPI0039E59CCA
MAGYDVERITRARRRFRIIRQIPYFVVLAVVAVAAILVLMDRWRRGTFVFGSALILGAIFRAVMPAERVGLLAVRSRAFDVTTMAGLGMLVIWLSTSIDSLGTGDHL